MSDKTERAVNLALMGRLTHIRAMLLKDYPFYGRLAMNLRFVIANCGTAATDMKTLIFDPAFLDNLSDEEAMVVMMHEILHCVLKHCIRGDGKIHYIYNVACDIVVNSNILESLGVKEFQVAGENMMHLTPSGVEGRLKTAEDVYYELVNQNLNEEFGDDKFPSYDNHEIWTCIEDEDGSLEGSWDNNIIKISKEKNFSLSGCPHDILEIIKDYDYKGKLKWKDVLKDFVTSYVSYTDYTFAPPDRRFSGGDYFLPAENDVEDELSLDMIWFCVDTSGSISKRKLTEMIMEIRNVIDECPGGVKLISFFDTEVTEPVPFKNKRDFDDIQPSGGGGTNFDIIFHYLKDNMMGNLPKAIVILTDGYAPEPNEELAMGIPVMWIINNNEVDISWGQVVRI